MKDTLNCFHCGLPITKNQRFSGSIAGKTCHFCCPACQAVATTIVEGGLGSFYHFHQNNQRPAPLVDEAHTFLAFDKPAIYRQFVHQRNGQASITLLVEDIHCAACVWLLERYLMRLPGMRQVIVSLNEQTVMLHWHSDQVLLSLICRTMAQIGYPPEPYRADQWAAQQQREHRQALQRLGVAGIGMMQVGMLAIALYAGALSMQADYRDFIRWMSLLVATPVVLYAAKPFFSGAWRSIRLGSPGMDLPVAIAIGLAFAASCWATISGQGEVYFDSVSMFTFFLLGGRYLEMRARHYAGRLNGDLLSLLPSTAVRITVDDQTGKHHQSTVAHTLINQGDILLIKPGAVVATDGIILDGDSYLDEAQLTGEFMPIHKTVGDRVVAGTTNGSGPLTIKVEAVGADLQIQAINRLLARAQSNKPALAQWADRVASGFISTVLALAAGTYLYWHWAAPDQALWITLSVLVVSCPCALSLATPAALTAVTSRLRREGLLVTQASVWEHLSTITDVVCDKTGTLTEGKCRLSAVQPLTDMTEARCLTIAAALESGSDHPIAQAFKDQPIKATVSKRQTRIGAGVEAVIDGQRYRLGRVDYAVEWHQDTDAWNNMPKPTDDGQWLLLSTPSKPCCWFQVQDSLRKDAAAFVAALRARGLTIHLLSGDSARHVTALGQQLHMDHCVSEASPQQKLAYIERLQKKGAKVLMLGDGINDIPVLAAADLSVAMSNASHLAKTQADSILLSGRLLTIVDLLTCGASTRRVIKQNVIWALCYNVSVIPLAALGFIPPYLAALGMSLSSLVVVVNALRLQRASRHRTLKRKPTNTPAVTESA